MRLVPVLLALGLIWARPAAAQPVTFNVFLDGSQEVGGGDPTGFATGSITLNPDLNTISWDIDYFDLSDPPDIYPNFLSGWHIHGPGGPAGVGAPILVNLDNLGGLTLPSGTLTGMLSGFSGEIDLILANPDDFYLNLHTTDSIGGGFPAGAIRGQLPEPSTALLLGLGLAGVAALKRRSRLI